MTEDNLDKLLADEMKKEFKPVGPRIVKPSQIGDIIQKATDEDTDRASRNFATQLHQIIESVEKEISEAIEVRRIINRRIHNLTHSLDTARAAVDMLEL